MTRYALTLPDIDYGTNPLQYPGLLNTITELPDKFYRFGTESGRPFHCFVDDWRIEAIWRHSHKMVDRVITSGYVVAPDFTVESNAPSIHALYQVWRSRVIARWWSDHGLYVIPVLQWSRPDINHLLFAGLHCCEVVAVRSPSKGYEAEWEQCAKQFLAVYVPKLVLHFGTKRGFDVWPNAVNLNLKNK